MGRQEAFQFAWRKGTTLEKNTKRNSNENKTWGPRGTAGTQLRAADDTAPHFFGNGFSFSQETKKLEGASSRQKNEASSSQQAKPFHIVTDIAIAIAFATAFCSGTEV